MSNKFLLLLILGVIFFSACSDSDKDPNYDGTYSDSNLELSRDGMTLSGKSASLQGNMLTLTNVIPGESALAIPVSLVDNVVTGISNNDSREISVAGKVEGGKMNLGLTVKNKVTDMQGKWVLPIDVDGISALHFDFTIDKEKVKFGETEVAPENVKQFVSIIFGAMLPTFLRDITLTENGNITASYNSDMENPQYATSPKGMAFYNLVNNKLYVSANIAGIMNDLGRSNADPTLQLITFVEQGIPFEISKDVVKGTTTLYLTRDVVVPFMALIPMLVEMMPEEFKSYATMLTDLATIIQESNSAEFGLVLIREVN